MLRVYIRIGQCRALQVEKLALQAWKFEEDGGRFSCRVVVGAAARSGPPTIFDVVVPTCSDPCSAHRVILSSSVGDL